MQTWWRSPSELDDDQKRIMALPPEGSFALKGPPGSGKTNLLLMRAGYLTLRHKHISVVVFNRTLAEFLKTGAAGYNVAPQSIMTSRQLILAMAREANLPISSTSGFEQGRAHAFELLGQIRRRTGRPIYDALLIDEAQDHQPEEIRALSSLSQDVFITTDGRQRIYRGGTEPENFVDVVDAVMELRFHYRNGPQICDLADNVGSTFSAGYQRIAPSSRYPSDGPRDEIKIIRGGLDSQIAAIANRLNVQLRAFRGELIGVFAPNRRDVARLAQGLSDIGYDDLLTVQLSDDGYLAMDPDRPICLSTVHGSKGLEFRAVHFASAETVRDHAENQKRLAFTGVTRAKTSLTIYHDKGLPGFFDSAVARWRDDMGETIDWTDVFNADF